VGLFREDDEQMHQAQDRRLSRMSIQIARRKSESYLCCLVFAGYFLTGIRPSASQYSVRTEQPNVQQSQLSQSSQMDCLDRMKEFVSDLDALMDQNPSTLEPFLGLLKRTFPLVECDIEEVTRIAKKSKYFISPSHNGSMLVFFFSSAKPSIGPFSGFDVSFGISKSTGNTELPFAKIHKGG
jgi:hypothetical protein